MNQKIEMMTPKQASDYLNMSYWTILDYARRGEIKHIRTGPRKGKILFRKQSLDEWLLQQEELSLTPNYIEQYRKEQKARKQKAEVRMW